MPNPGNNFSRQNRPWGGGTRIDDRKIRFKLKMRDINELQEIEKKLEYRNSIMSGAKKRGTRAERKEKLAAWAKKKGITFTAPELTRCPHCLGLMKAALARIQIRNMREGGVECLACISGFSRKKKCDPTFEPTGFISVKELIKQETHNKIKS